MGRAVAAVLAAALLILSGLAAGLVYWLGVDQPRPVLLIQHQDGNLILADAAGDLRPLTTDADGRGRIYAFPVPAPDGRAVAYVETLHGTSDVTSSVIVQRLRGGRAAVYDSRTSRPFYLYWSPDSRQLAFLSGDPDGMVLRTVNTLGKPAPRQVIPGQPSYFAWTPDSRRLLLHTGDVAPRASISIWSFQDTQPRPWAAQPALFRAPAWLDDGRTVVAAVIENETAVLARFSADGNIQQRLASAHVGMVFTPSPDGKTVSYVPLEPRSIGNLHLVNVDGTDHREFETGAVFTFLWSPDGARIAYITAAEGGTRSVFAVQQQAPRLTWHVLDVASGEMRALQTFEPSAEFLNLLPFFDQYALSLRLWDKAGKRLVYADADGVWTLDAATGATRKVDQGVLGMWIER
jgi:TolB protein